MNNYIQVDIGGQLRGLKFNQLSLEVFTKHINENAVAASSIYATFYAGLIGNCYAKNEEPTFTFSDVTDWVDRMYEEGRKEDIVKVCDLWNNTHAYKDWLKEFNQRLNDILSQEPKNKKKVK